MPRTQINLTYVCVMPCNMCYSCRQHVHLFIPMISPGDWGCKSWPGGESASCYCHHLGHSVEVADVCAASGGEGKTTKPVIFYKHASDFTPALPRAWLWHVEEPRRWWRWVLSSVFWPPLISAPGPAPGCTHWWVGTTPGEAVMTLPSWEWTLKPRAGLLVHL